MLKHTLALIVAVAAVSLAAPGTGTAGGSACSPVCEPAKSSNSGSNLQGLNRAIHVAGDHGKQGRDKAVEKQDAHRPGGSGVYTPPPSPSPPPDGTGGTDTGGGTPCSGC